MEEGMDLERLLVVFHRQSGAQRDRLLGVSLCL